MKNKNKAFEESTIVTKVNINKINFDSVVFVHITDLSGMGNTGGIILYVLENKKIKTYENNINYEPEVAKLLESKFYKNKEFTSYKCSVGSVVYVRNSTQLEIDKNLNCIWVILENTKMKLNLYSIGLFETLVRLLERDKTHINHN